MAKFHDQIGFSITAENKVDEVGNGIWEEVVVEKKYYGIVINDKISRRSVSDKLIDNLDISNVISILGDSYAFLNFYNIKYVRHCGINWTVLNVTVQAPRLILALGGVYNDQT